MSTTPVNNTNNVSGRVSRLARTYSRVTSVEPTNATATDHLSAWINSFTRLNQAFSGTLLHLLLRLIDISLLSFGLYHDGNTCGLNNSLCIISILLLIFNVIDIVIVIGFLLRYSSLLEEEEKSKRFLLATILRGCFMIFKFITVCIGTYYVFTSIELTNTNCEFVRFCLGIVCFSTWLIPLIGIPQPALPVRRSLFIECATLLLFTIFLSSYLGTVAPVMIEIQDPKCTFTNMKDFYFHAPLKSFAYIGLILTGCLLCMTIFNCVFNQLFFRLIHWQTFVSRCLILIYALWYFIAFVVIYYYSVGAILLFEPRSGGSCRSVAPNLYKTLLIWQWIRIIGPLILTPLLCVFCCIGLCVGSLLAACLPASISVPLLEALRGRLPTAPVPINPNPPARQESTDDLPIVSFGEESNQFDQSECTICRIDFQPNEQVRRLQCGHLFHPGCVDRWLLTTRICPVCRQRMTMTDV